jgi:hypothetical protein
MAMKIDRIQLWLTALTILWLLTAMFVIGLFRAETLRVRRVEILNSQGKTVAVLGISPTDGGVLLLYDGNGSLRAAVGLTTENNAAIDLNDASGQQRVTIQVNDDGSVTVKGLRGR